MNPQTTLFSFIPDAVAASAPNLASAPPRKKRGRHSQQLSEAELKECLAYYFERNPLKKQQILARYGKKKISDALNIFRIDYGKQGALSRIECPIHKKANLGYGWHGMASGARIKCMVPGCTSLNTHFEPMLYHSEECMEMNGLSHHREHGEA
ncbi:MAG: hypothetical protein NWE93_11320 [Candidatus Bathyarchaeota archaeon]|nr:hypothetical protein [Candidatus Bathyarchaeota archaeon]